MTQDKVHGYVRAFVTDYKDPGVDKRLWFEVWSEREGLNLKQKRVVWEAVKHYCRRQAGLKASRKRAQHIADASQCGWQEMRSTN